ncbi:MAG: DUF58 domain-containing protein [Planctomycetota bacterium]|jgi:uncharacterized protein (DUF58 family)
MITPTGRAIVLALLGVFVALLPVWGMGTFFAWVLVVTVTVLLIGADALLCDAPEQFDTEVVAPAALFIGDSDPATLRLRSRKDSYRADLQVRLEATELLVPQPDQAVSVEPGQAIEAWLPLVPRRRGEARLERLWLRWSGPLGLVRRQIARPLGTRVAVVPHTRAVKQAAIRFFGSKELMTGLKTERYVGDGSEFDALRKFVPGFDPRAIDWKASAHHRELLVRQFRAERNHQIVLAFDTGHLMGETIDGIPKIDHAINAALVLGYVSLKTGDRVGLFGFDQNERLYMKPVAGVQGFAKLRARTAELEYAAEETNFTLAFTQLLTRLKRRSLVICFTDFVDTITAELMVENLSRVAKRHVVIFCALRDPSLASIASGEPGTIQALHQSVVATDMVRERELVIRRLRQMSIHALDVLPREIGADLLNRYLDIKRRELV